MRKHHLRHTHRHHPHPLHRARGMRERVVTLTDTRQVDCVVYSANGRPAGLSCDWSHVSGADKEPQ